MSNEPPTAGREQRPAARRNVRAAMSLAWSSYPLGVVGALTAALISGLMPVAATLLLRSVIDAVAAGQPIASAIVPGVGLALVGVVGVIASTATEYLGGQLRRRLQVVTTEQLFTAVASWPGLARFETPAYFDRLRLGQRAGSNTPHQLVVSGIVGVQGAVSVAGFTVTLLVINPIIAGFVLLAAAPAIPVNLALSREQAQVDWSNSPVERRVQMTSSLLADAPAAKEIRLFGIARFLQRRLLADLTLSLGSEAAVQLRSVRRNTILGLLGSAVSATAIVWAVVEAGRGQLSVGDLTAMVVALTSVEPAAATTVRQVANVHRFLLTFEHYITVTSEPSDLPIAAEPHSAGSLKRGIEFRGVWFRYDPSLPWALRDLNMTLPAGESTGLVGLNGSGKSTIVKLLCRFYDPQQGQIVWDGNDLRDIDPIELRTHMTAVFQDFVSYELTLAENIAVGDLSALANPERITRAADTAGLSDLASSLPRGQDTLLSRALTLGADPDDAQTGTTLSGGQWQRVAIARAAVRSGRDLMILDEPTAGLDPRAEHEVVAELKRQRTGGTSLVISHRMGTIRDLDTVVVIDHGHVSETGTHSTLMRAAGKYAQLFQMQAQDYIDRNERPEGCAG